MPGIFRSQRIRSGPASAAKLRPAVPSAADTTSKPCLLRNLIITRRKLSSSSMTKILLGALVASGFILNAAVAVVMSKVRPVVTS